MCAIIDANVAHEVFGSNRPSAGKEFFDWINKGRGRLVAGGNLLAELNRTSARDWARQALNAGLIRNVSDEYVNARTTELLSQQRCRSDDPHIIALAQISGARLLYSNDGDLRDDFKTKSLVDKPRGKVYSTRETGDFTTSHRNLLTRKDLCQT